jgi:hypothetical protein
MDFAFITPNVGDLTEVQAGTGISVADGTGPIPIVTNTVATEFDAKGDLVVGTGSDTFDRLAVGTDGFILVADSSVSPTGLKWAVDPVADVVTTAGDLIYGTAADTVARLGIGTAGQVLQVNSGATAPEWAAAGASSGPAFRAFRNTSAQSVTAATWTKVQLNGETFDTASCFDSTTNFRFTPNVSGYYSLLATLLGEVEDATTKFVSVAIYKNGAVVAQGTKAIGQGSAGVAVVNDLIYFNGTTDYVELFGFISAGNVNENFINGTDITYFSGVWIRS